MNNVVICDSMMIRRSPIKLTKAESKVGLFWYINNQDKVHPINVSRYNSISFPLVCNCVDNFFV